MGLTVNEAAFNQSVSYKNKAVTAMNSVNSNLSSVSIPDGYSNVGEIRGVLKGISTNISPNVKKFEDDFVGYNNNMILLRDSENSDSVEANIIRDSNGNIIGLKTVEGFISLDGFQKKESENGTFYVWMDQPNSNFNISCNIYIPKVKKISGMIVYFTDTSGLDNHDNYRQIVAGTYKTDSIIIMPHNDDIYRKDSKNPIMFAGISSGLAQLIHGDLINVAKAFNIDEKNISVYGFSSGARLATNMVSNCPDGSFRNIVLAGNTDDISQITDPNVKVIVLSGAGEGENASFVRGQLEAYSQTHSNETEYYVLSDRADGKRVTHVYLDDTAATSDVFGGENIFQYLGGDGSSTETEVTPEVTTTPGPTATPAPGTTSTPSTTAEPTRGVDDYNELDRKEMLELKNQMSRNKPTTPTPKPEEPKAEDPEVGLNIEDDTDKTPVSDKKEPDVKDDTDKTPAANEDDEDPPYNPPSHSDSAPATVEPASVPTYILPENKFSELIPNITNGNLDSMEISAVHANYDLSGISDDIYNNYLNSLKQSGYTLGTDGTTWVKGNYTLNLIRSNTDLNIYFKVNI